MMMNHNTHMKKNKRDANDNKNTPTIQFNEIFVDACNFIHIQNTIYSICVAFFHFYCIFLYVVYSLAIPFVILNIYSYLSLLYWLICMYRCSLFALCAYFAYCMNCFFSIHLFLSFSLSFFVYFLCFVF